MARAVTGDPQEARREATANPLPRGATRPPRQNHSHKGNNTMAIKTEQDAKIRNGLNKARRTFLESCVAPGFQKVPTAAGRRRAYEWLLTRGLVLVHPHVGGARVQATDEGARFLRGPEAVGYTPPGRLQEMIDEATPVRPSVHTPRLESAVLARAKRWQARYPKPEPAMGAGHSRELVALWSAVESLVEAEGERVVPPPVHPEFTHDELLALWHHVPDEKGVALGRALGKLNDYVLSSHADAEAKRRLSR